MQINSIFDEQFRRYGNVISGYDVQALLDTLNEKTVCDSDAVVYVPSFEPLEKLPLYDALSNGFFGGMPIQIGYCNGNNHLLNCLEYHRDSEINIPTVSMIFLVAPQQAIVNGSLDTSLVEAFRAPAGAVVELYATTLHYAPVTDCKEEGFRVAVVLPKGTNTEKPDIKIHTLEDHLLFARNKWLIAHPDAPEAQSGAYVGLKGENICV